MGLTHEKVTIEGCRLIVNSINGYVFEVPGGNRIVVPKSAVYLACDAMQRESGGDLITIRAVADKYKLKVKEA